jgi:hypothetical protein
LKKGAFNGAFFISPDGTSVSNPSEKSKKTGILGRIWGELGTLGRTWGEQNQFDFDHSAAFHLSLTIRMRRVDYMLKSTRNEQPYQRILKEYPPVISKEQLYKLCGVSKKTALHYLINGLIPCECSGKKTHSYHIKTTDVVQFLRMRDQSPSECHAPAGWYKNKNGKYILDMSPAVKKRLQVAIEQLLENYPDVLTAKQVSEITGYSSTSVGKWCHIGRLHHFRIRGKNRIPKASLLAFLGSDDYRFIAATSRKDSSFHSKTDGGNK